MGEPKSWNSNKIRPYRETKHEDAEIASMAEMKDRISFDTITGRSREDYILESGGGLLVHPLAGNLGVITPNSPVKSGPIR